MIHRGSGAFGCPYPVSAAVAPGGAMLGRGELLRKRVCHPSIAIAGAPYRWDMTVRPYMIGCLCKALSDWPRTAVSQLQPLYKPVHGCAVSQSTVLPGFVVSLSLGRRLL